MKAFPLNNYLIVKQNEAQAVSAGGIILSAAKDIPDTATVIKPSPENKEGLNVGDKVILRWNEAAKIDGKMYAVKAESLICRIED